VYKNAEKKSAGKVASIYSDSRIAIPHRKSEHHTADKLEKTHRAILLGDRTQNLHHLQYPGPGAHKSLNDAN